MKRYLIAATAALATASPHLHKHKHRQLHNHVERAQTTTPTTPDLAVATVFEAAGALIDKTVACDLVEKGTLTWKNPADAVVCEDDDTDAPAATPSSDAGQFYDANKSSDWTSSSWTDVSGQGIDADFPDGTIDCGTFPSSYGALPVSYLGLGGWSGLQDVGSNDLSSGVISTIHTLLSGDTCREGCMCSYACPAGYTKTQWPSAQGATGQSVGGLSCSGGKLRLTNPSLSKKLCMAGVGGVQAQNNAGSVVSICRTDYPGTESETIPVALQPGQTQELNNPDSATSYRWQNKDTTAQYYLNPIGVGPERACQWGDSSQPIGNWAPINFGVGHKDGKTWLSMFQNKPTTYEKYQGRVQLTGDLSAQCYYENGKFYGATGANDDGCTVAVLSGTATYVISS